MRCVCKTHSVSVTTVKCKHRKNPNFASRKPYLLSLTALLKIDCTYAMSPFGGGPSS